MPIYEYNCKNCGKFEHLHMKINERLKECPKCGADLEQLMSPCNSIFVGNGFYKTDYCPTKQTKKDKEDK